MPTFQKNNYGPIESIIFESGLSIKGIEIKRDFNKLFVFLNTEHILVLPLSLYSRLKEATVKDLQNFTLIAGGTGIHWPNLDEDLSLKGFLKDALTQMVTTRDLVVA